MNEITLHEYGPPEPKAYIQTRKAVYNKQCMPTKISRSTICMSRAKLAKIDWLSAYAETASTKLIQILLVLKRSRVNLKYTPSLPLSVSKHQLYSQV